MELHHFHLCVMAHHKAKLRLRVQVLHKHALTMNTAHTVSAHLSASTNLRISNEDIGIHSSALAIVLIVRMPLCQHIVVFNILLDWP